MSQILVTFALAALTVWAVLAPRRAETHKISGAHILYLASCVPYAVAVWWLAALPDSALSFFLPVWNTMGRYATVISQFDPDFDLRAAISPLHILSYAMIRLVRGNMVVLAWLLPALLLLQFARTLVGARWRRRAGEDKAP